MICKQTISLLLFLLLGSSLLAQHDFKPGYIINNVNDTIFGEIDLRSNVANSEACAFRVDGEIKKYKPFEIYSYRIEGEKYYVSREVVINEKTYSYFLEFLVEGISNLYYLRKGFNDYFFLEKGDRMVLLDNSEIEITDEEGRNFVKNSDRYKGVMTYFFSDAPELQSRIKETDFEYKPLINVTKAYHNAVCDDYKCIDYTKSTKTTYVIEPYVGVGFGQLQFEGSSQPLNSVLPQVGVNFVFKPLRAYKAWNFEVGLGFEKNNYSGKITDYKGIINDYIDVDINFSAATVPIKVRYEFPGDKFQPYISAGLDNKIIFGGNSTIKQHLSTFYRPREVDASLKTFNYNLSAGLGMKYKRSDNNYWFLRASFHRLKMYGTNSLMDGLTFQDFSFSVGYGFMKQRK